MTSNVQTYMRQGRCFLLEGNPVRAIDLLKKAKACCGEESHVKALILKDLVAACRAAGRSEEAGRYYLELKAMTPSVPNENITFPPARNHHFAAWVALLVSLVVVCLGVGGIYWVTLPATHSQHGTIPIGGPAPRDKRIAENTGLVVIIGTYKAETGGLEIQIPFSSGTAFAFHKDGYMLTNRHVVEGRNYIPDEETFGNGPPIKFVLKSKKVIVCFGEKKEDRLDASVTSSERIDLAVLHVSRTFSQPYKLLDGVTNLGAQVQAAGYPGDVMEFLNEANQDQDSLNAKLKQMESAGRFDFFDLQFQSPAFIPGVFTGHVSQPQVPLPDLLTKQPETCVQFDGTIEHGNSGGPLLDENDNVVGMVTRLMNGNNEAAGVNFAISSVELRKEVSIYIQPH